MRYGNKSAISKLIKQRNEVIRPGWIFTQISAKVYDELDYFIEGWIDNQLRVAPSVGKTFKSQVI